MNVKDGNSIKIIKEGKKISEEEKAENQKQSKNKTMIMYLIPLVSMIIIAIIYIITQISFLLILFGVLMFITLWGWDSSTRTCCECKKWNSAIWIKTERLSRKTTIKKKSLIKKGKTKEIMEKYTRLTGRCKNCECEFEIEKNSII